MTEHTKTDGLPGIDAPAQPQVLERSRPRNERMAGDKIECNACPVLCQISRGQGRRLRPLCQPRWHAGAGRSGAAAAAHAGRRRRGAWCRSLPRESPGRRADWNGDLLLADEVFVTGVGSSTTYPDYKPAPFIVASQAAGVDMVTVVTEGIFSYCSLKVKIDTDRYLGPEQANVRCKGEVVGHVTTAEYGSQMLSLGGVHHLTGGSKKEGRVTCEMMVALGNKQAVELHDRRRRAACGCRPAARRSSTASKSSACGWAAARPPSASSPSSSTAYADEVVVVDDHITGVLTEHQAGRCLDMRASGIKMRGRKSTPGRYFQVANPGTGWGGTDIADPLSIIERLGRRARPGPACAC